MSSILVECALLAVALVSGSALWVMAVLARRIEDLREPVVQGPPPRMLAKGGYSGSQPASSTPPPPRTPSATIRPERMSG